MDFHNAILRCGFLCTLLIPALFVSILFYGNHAEGYHAPSLPPRAITPVYASRLSRHSIFLLLCYHTRAITLNRTRTSGYHTHHSSSYFIVYLSPAITPPVLFIYTTTGAPHVPTYSTVALQVADYKCTLSLGVPLMLMLGTKTERYYVKTKTKTTTTTLQWSVPYDYALHYWR